jgi:hypothetical protein
LLSLPPGTEMFQFPGFPVSALCVQAELAGHDSSRVSPFGNSWIYGWLAPPQDLSQLPTSFFGSRSLGIHRMPFLLAVKMLALAMEFSRIRQHRNRRRPASSNATRGSRGEVRREGSLLQSCTGCPTFSEVRRPGHDCRTMCASTLPSCSSARSVWQSPQAEVAAPKVE